MLQKPQNYEEARKIILEAVHDDLHEHVLKITKLKAYIIGALVIGAAIAAGIAAKSPMLTFTMIPAAAIFDSPFIFQILEHIHAVKNVDSGRFLYHLSDEETIKLASEYADDYNAFEEKHGRKHK